MLIDSDTSESSLPCCCRRTLRGDHRARLDDEIAQPRVTFVDLLLGYVVASMVHAFGNKGHTHMDRDQHHMKLYEVPVALCFVDEVELAGVTEHRLGDDAQAGASGQRAAAIASAFTNDRCVTGCRMRSTHVDLSTPFGPARRWRTGTRQAPELAAPVPSPRTTAVPCSFASVQVRPVGVNSGRQIQAGQAFTDLLVPGCSHHCLVAFAELVVGSLAREHTLDVDQVMRLKLTTPGSLDRFNQPFCVRGVVGAGGWSQPRPRPRLAYPGSSRCSLCILPLAVAHPAAHCFGP